MTPEEIEARKAEIRSRLEELNKEYEGRAFPAEVKDEFEGLESERRELEDLEKELRTRQQVVEAAAAEPEAREAGFQVRKPRARGDEVYDLSTVRSSVSNPHEAIREMRDRAKYAIENGDFAASSVDPDEARANAEKLLGSRVDREGGLSRRMLETGSGEYMRAFGKKLVSAPLTDSEQRALSTANGDGGYAIPFTLDPTVIHTNAQSVNPYRSISRVIQVTGDNWQGITSAGVTASYKQEAAEADDNSPSFDQPSIHPERADCFIPYSMEIGQDWSGLVSELTLMIQEAKDDLETVKFTSGDGSDEPQGVLVGGTVDYTTIGTAAFAVGDVYGAEEALAPRHRQRASWVANRSIYNRTRQFDTQGGASIWYDNLQKGLGNQVPGPGRISQDLLGYPTYECSAFGTSLTGGSVIGVIGDFSKFAIVDRIGMNVELIPHLFATANNRPSGQRGLFAVWRNSSEVLDPNAFRRIKTRS